MLVSADEDIGVDPAVLEGSDGPLIVLTSVMVDSNVITFHKKKVNRRCLEILFVTKSIEKTSVLKTPFQSSTFLLYVCPFLWVILFINLKRLSCIEDTFIHLRSLA